MKVLLFYLLTLIGMIWIQTVGNYFVGVTGISLNIVLVVVIYFGLARGPLSGEVLGFFGGLFVDAGSLGLVGLHALLYAGVGYLAGMLRRQLDGKKVWTQSIFSFGISLIYLVLYFILDRLFADAPHPMSWSLALQPFVNAALAPVIFWLLQQWSYAWSMATIEE